MKERNIIFGILALFLVIQTLGLYTTSQLIPFLEENPEMEPFENPQDAGNSLVIFGYILFGTAILILIIKYVKNLLSVLELIMVFFASEITFEALVPYAIAGFPVAIIFAGALAIWKFKWPSVLNQNIALVFSISGAGALLGVSLGVLPIMIFAAILSVYDIISVFFTKHMVYMAKAITEKPFAFTASIPASFSKPKNVKSLQTGKVMKKRSHVFQLGGGDLAIPLMMAASVYRYFSFAHALFISAGALIATFFIFWYVLRKPGKPLPALPPIVAGSFIGFAASLLFI